MKNTLEPLQEAFLADHKILTQGLEELRQAVERRDRIAARQIAERIDHDAGPHIDFEESSFYPRLVDVLGAEFVARLYREHDCGRNVLEKLCASDASTDVAWDELRELLTTASDHAASCGTLTSHLATFSPVTRDSMLAELMESRLRRTRWTQIDRTHRGAVGGGSV